MRSSRALAAVAVVLATVMAAPGRASGDCSGPTIEHDVGSIDRDGTVRVVGTVWGDNCYDTGPPPEGESVLGKPVTGIEILLVQLGVEHLVATGDADEDFEFEVEVPVPDELEPGPVTLVARSRLNVNTYDATPGQLVISSEPPTGTSDDAPVRFGDPAPEPRLESAPSKATPSEDAARNDDGSDLTTIAAAAGAVLLVAALLAAGARRRRRR